jgi:hypothetical protein
VSRSYTDCMYSQTRKTRNVKVSAHNTFSWEPTKNKESSLPKKPTHVSHTTNEVSQTENRDIIKSLIISLVLLGGEFALYIFYK